MTTKRRGHGEGNIKQRADGLWEARVSLPGGKRKSLYGKTRREAQEKLRAALRDLDAGVDLATGRQTVGQFLDRWLDDVVKPGVRPKTHHSYAQLVRLHLKPALGHHQLAKLTPQHVQAMMTEKSAAGLSPRTVQYLRAVLRRALGQALKWGLVARNVATLADRPARRNAPSRPSRPIRRGRSSPSPATTGSARSSTSPSPPASGRGSCSGCAGRMLTSLGAPSRSATRCNASAASCDWSSRRRPSRGAR